ncbi:hypothetical protein, partial [Bacillus spongiae]|uniref:hypothetical protein n=1 Tax=Bacillus spongiae TaxID=2683610 RepID=UPI003AF6A716
DLNRKPFFLVINQLGQFIIRYFLANMAIAFFKISISCFIFKFSFWIAAMSCGVNWFSSPATGVKALIHL